MRMLRAQDGAELPTPTAQVKAKEGDGSYCRYNKSAASKTIRPIPLALPPLLPLRPAHPLQLIGVGLFKSLLLWLPVVAKFGFYHSLDRLSELLARSQCRYDHAHQRAII